MARTPLYSPSTQRRQRAEARAEAAADTRASMGDTAAEIRDGQRAKPASTSRRSACHATSNSMRQYEPRLLKAISSMFLTGDRAWHCEARKEVKSCSPSRISAASCMAARFSV